MRSDLGRCLRKEEIERQVSTGQDCPHSSNKKTYRVPQPIGYLLKLFYSPDSTFPPVDLHQQSVQLIHGRKPRLGNLTVEDQVDQLRRDRYAPDQCAERFLNGLQRRDRRARVSQRGVGPRVTMKQERRTLRPPPRLSMATLRSLKS